MLDVVGVALARHNIGFTRLDGSMPQPVREANISQFRSKRNVRVFLVSMKAGGVGLNLTAAEQVFLLDPWWNPAAEDQAIDRVHRLGQLHPVTVVRYVVRGTVEERLIEMQENKRQMAHGALSGQSAALRKMRVEELQALFL
jgi:SNF2 family DNA or RNA helicase